MILEHRTMHSCVGGAGIIILFMPGPIEFLKFIIEQGGLYGKEINSTMCTF